jgi:hypothetical protein
MLSELCSMVYHSQSFHYGILLLGTFGGVHGAINGLNNWHNWFINYKPVVFTSKYFQQYAGIVDSSLCVGCLVLNLLYYATTGAIVSMTCVVSVPALLYFCERKKN